MQSHFDPIPDAVLIEAEQRWTYANPAACALLRAASPAELVGQPIWNVIPPEAHQRVAVRRASVADGSRVPVIDATLVRLDGSRIAVELKVDRFPLAGAGALVIIARDVTERNALNARFRATFEQSAVGMAHVALDGRWLRVNDRFCEMVRYSADELLSMRFADLMYPDEQMEEHIERARALATGAIGPYTIERRYLRRDDSVIWVSISVSIVRPLHDDPYFVAILEDVTARRAAEEAHRASEARLRSLIENGDELLAIVDGEAQMVWVSESVRRILGYTPDELQSQQAFAFVHPDDIATTVDAFAEIVGSPCGRRRLTARARAADGSWRELDLSVVNMTDRPEIGGIVINARDVTEQNRVRGELEQLRRVESLGRVAANVTHEFNNVLMSIEASTLALQRRHAAQEESAALFSALREAIRRGKHTTAEVLRYARPALLMRDTFAVGPWLTELADDLRRVLAPSHTLTLAVDEGLPLLRADRQQLARAVSNLVLNARDASAAGGSVALEARHGAPDNPLGVNVIELAVRDQGSGIPPELLEHVAEPLFTTKRGGTGLGLAIVQQTVARHGGRLVVESEPGVGTTMRLLLHVA